MGGLAAIHSALLRRSGRIIGRAAAPAGIADQLASGTAGTSARRLLVALEVDDAWQVNANPANLDYLIPTTVTAGALGNGLDLVPN